MRILAIAAAALIALAAMPIAAMSAEKAAVGATTATEAAKPGALATRKLPGKTVKGVVGTTAGVMELTADECTALGGTVHDSTAMCKSGKYCGREDESGTRHRTCLEVAAQ